MSDLIYEEDEENEDDSFINRLDTSNSSYHKAKNSRSTFEKGSDLIFKPISIQLDAEIRFNIDLLRKIYRSLVRPKFVTGDKELEEMQKMPLDEEDKNKLDESDSESGGEDLNEVNDENEIKPHLRNLPTKEELIKIEKRKGFIGETYGYFR